jgi:hypothetical protein
MEEEYDSDMDDLGGGGFGRTLSFFWGLKVRPKRCVVYNIPEDHYLVISMSSLGAENPKGERAALLIEDGGVLEDSDEESGEEASDLSSDSEGEQEAMMNGYSASDSEGSGASRSAESLTASDSGGSASSQSASSSGSEHSDKEAGRPSKRAVVACVLLRDKAESQPLNLEIAGPRQLRFWVQGEDTIHLTGHIEIEAMTGFSDDDDDDTDMEYMESGSEGGIDEYSFSGSSSASDDEPLPPPPSALSQRRNVRITEIKEEEHKEQTTGKEAAPTGTRSKTRNSSVTPAPAGATDPAFSSGRSDQVKESKPKQKGHKEGVATPTPANKAQSTAAGRGKKDEGDGAQKDHAERSTAQAGKQVRFVPPTGGNGKELPGKQAKGNAKAGTGSAEAPSDTGATAAGATSFDIACNQCGKHFKLASALEQHMQAKHAS